MSTIPKNPNPITGKEMPHPQEIPKPGSKEAIEQGCRCHLYEHPQWGECFKGCPLHDPERSNDENKVSIY